MAHLHGKMQFLDWNLDEVIKSRKGLMIVIPARCAKRSRGERKPESSDLR